MEGFEIYYMYMKKAGRTNMEKLRVSCLGWGGGRWEGKRGNEVMN